MSTTKANTKTPWGLAQASREIAPGIVWHQTASHGGFFVAPERVAEMPKLLRDFQPWAGAYWYEEDCDWCLVALAFSQHFPADTLPVALATLKSYQPDLYDRALAAGLPGMERASHTGRPGVPIVIEVRGGVVQDVLNVPTGYSVEVRAYDNDLRQDGEQV